MGMGGLPAEDDLEYLEDVEEEEEEADEKDEAEEEVDALELTEEACDGRRSIPNSAPRSNLLMGESRRVRVILAR